MSANLTAYRNAPEGWNVELDTNLGNSPTDYQGGTQDELGIYRITNGSNLVVLDHFEGKEFVIHRTCQDRDESYMGSIHPFSREKSVMFCNMLAQDFENKPWGEMMEVLTGERQKTLSEILKEPCNDVPYIDFTVKD